MGVIVETRHLLGYTNAYDYVYNKLTRNNSCKILHNAKIIKTLEELCRCTVTKHRNSMMFLPVPMYRTITELEFNTKEDLTMFLLRWT